MAEKLRPPTREEIQYQNNVQQAWVDGQQIQQRARQTGRWHNVARPQFDWVRCDYRVALTPMQEMQNQLAESNSIRTTLEYSFGRVNINNEAEDLLKTVIGMNKKINVIIAIDKDQTGVADDSNTTE